MDTAALIGRSENLFGKRQSLVSLWQEIGEQTYPERADFTRQRSLGSDFADNLTTSYPIILRRDLGNSFSAMLRSTAIPWFSMSLKDDEEADHSAREWMEWATGRQRKLMYDRKSQFTRATKEGDHDFAAFGQAVLSVQMNRELTGLLYRCWHLRDCAWCENENGIVDTMYRKWKPTARELVAMFRNVHPKVREKLSGPKADPYCEINCLHIVIPGADYKPEFSRFPFVSIFLDVDNKHIMEEVGQRYFMYVVPRWQTVSGSQYSYSPATVAAMPDARLLQAISLTLLEAGEKASNPPMIATQDAIRSDISLFAGGITTVDKDYDERLGDALRPISQNYSGIGVGLDLRRDIMALMRDAYFLNALSLPQTGPEMTAYEVGQRVQEYIRQASPIFEPLEAEYNGALCETTFEVLMLNGAFGRISDIPESLHDADVGFRFASPLHDVIERQKLERFTEVKAVLADTMALDPSVVADINVRAAFRDVIQSSGAPAKWMNSDDEAEAILAQQQAKQQAAELLQTMGAGAEVAEQIGKAGQAMQGQELAA
jgi:hypothetical protein